MIKLFDKLIIILIIILLLLLLFSLQENFIQTYENIDNQKNEDEKIDNVALLIPLHPKHYDFIYNLLDKIKNKMDLYIVFSNNDDYSQFNKKDMIFPIILDHEQYNGNVVTYKKFYGLKYLIDSNYDYIINCDAEIDIILNNFTKKHVNDKINEIFENKIIYAGVSSEKIFSDITMATSSVFNDEEIIKKLKIITEDFKLFYWWSDLPVYKREHLKDFFSKINYDNMNFNYFDYKIYYNYLFAYHDFKFINLTEDIGHNYSLEIFFDFISNIRYISYLKDKGYGFSWVNHNFYNNNINFLKKDTFIIFHLDREKIL